MSTALIALAAGAIGIVVLILWAMRRGRKQAEARIIEGRLDAMKERQEIDRDIEGNSDDTRHSRARRYVRPDG